MACQLEELRTCFTLAAIMNTLKSLPKTLDEVYDRVLLRIPENNREMVHRALQWLVFSKRPLHLQELAAAVVIETGVSVLSSENSFFEPQDVLNLCSNLVSYSDHTGLLGLAHYSVQEYLVSRRIREGRAAFYNVLEVPAHRLLAETCLTYLLSFDGSSSGDTQRYPLLRYAAENWYIHLCTVSLDSNQGSLTTMACELLDHRVTQAFRNWVKLHQSSEHTVGDRTLRLTFTFWTPPLTYACHWGMLEVVRLLLEKGADVNCKDTIYKRTALMVAAAAGHSKVVEMLLQNGANADLSSGDGETALSEAILSKRVFMIRLLIKHSKTNLNFANGRGGALLQEAARDGDLAFMKLLLDNGANINARSRLSGQCALHYATEAKQPAAMQLILDKGIRTDKGSFLEPQTLHVISQLPAQRAKVETLGQKNGIDCSSGGSDEPVFRPFPGNKADIDAKDYDGETALHLATITGMELPVQLLLSAGASINAQNHHGETALLMATSSGDKDLVQLLLKNGADPGVRERTGETALHKATSIGRVSLIQRLLDAGANIDALNADHETPLLKATSLGHEEVVQLLLRNGADIGAKDKMGWTALRISLSVGHQSVVQRLLEAGADIHA